MIGFETAVSRELWRARRLSERENSLSAVFSPRTKVRRLKRLPEYTWIALSRYGTFIQLNQFLFLAALGLCL
jgi:hypothetical protein